MVFMTNKGINPALVIKTHGWKDEEATVTGLEIVQRVPKLLCGEEEEINTEFQLETMLRASKLYIVSRKKAPTARTYATCPVIHTLEKKRRFRLHLISWQVDFVMNFLFTKILKTKEFSNYKVKKKIILI